MCPLLTPSLMAFHSIMYVCTKFAIQKVDTQQKPKKHSEPESPILGGPLSSRLFPLECLKMPEFG